MKKYCVIMDDGEYWHYSKPFNTHEEAAALAQVLKQSFDEGLYIFIEAEKE